MNMTDQKYQEIVDYISKELTEPERADFEVWLNASEQNKKAYQQVLRKVLITRWSLKSTLVNTDLAYKKFEKKVNTQLRLLYYVAAAASIVILFSISLPFLLNDQFEKVENIAQTTIIEPGKRGAELILSTGESVMIEENTKEIKEKDGSLIRIDSLKGVEYSAEVKSSPKEIYNTLKIPRGREFDILLADGTRVWLNADSELKYPVQFIGGKRQVYLKGEAYFDVTPDKEKAFVVNSYNQEVRVYGTEFCINAYNQNEIKTVLVEGSVGVKENSKGFVTKLKPGELASPNKLTGQIEVKKVNIRPYVAWKDGDFVFENESLESIMLRLERWYNVKVFFMNDACKKFRFTGDMKRYSEVKDLLYFMEETSNVKFEIKKNAIVVMAK